MFQYKFRPEFVTQIFHLDFVKLVAVFLLTLPIAYNRENVTNIMGLRTFPLVAIATCSYVLVSNTFTPATASDAEARIAQGFIAGIGFIAAALF